MTRDPAQLRLAAAREALRFGDTPLARHAKRRRALQTLAWMVGLLLAFVALVAMVIFVFDRIWWRITHAGG